MPLKQPQKEAIGLIAILGGTFAIGNYFYLSANPEAYSISIGSKIIEILSTAAV